MWDKGHTDSNLVAGAKNYPFNGLWSRASFASLIRLPYHHLSGGPNFLRLL